MEEPVLMTTQVGPNATNSGFPIIPSQGQWNPPAQQQPTTSPIGVLPQASYLYQQGGPQPYPFYTQSYFTPLQEQGYGTTLQGLQTGVGQALQNQALAHSLQSGFNQYLAGQGMSASPGYINQIGGSFNPWKNPALDESVQRSNEALVRDFNQGVVPQVDSRAVMTGGFGSNRHAITRGLSEQALADAMAKNTADLYRQGFESGMNRYVADRGNTLNTWLGANRNALSGWQAAPSIASFTTGANVAVPQALTGLGAGQANVGGYYQGLANQYLAQQQDMWNQYANRPYDNLNWYANLVYGNPAAQSQSQTTQTSAETPMLPNIIGGGLLGYGLWNQFGNQDSGGGTDLWSNFGNTPFTNPANFPGSNPSFQNWWQ